MPSRTPYGSMSREQRKAMIGGRLQQMGTPPTNPLLAPRQVAPSPTTTEHAGFTNTKYDTTDSDMEEARKNASRFKASGGLKKRLPTSLPKRPPSQAEREAAENGDEEFEGDDYEPEGGGRSIPRPPGSSRIRQQVTDRRRDRPANYKIHVITALSLAFLIRVAALGKKSLGLP